MSTEDTIQSVPATIEVPVWYRNGGLMTRRDCLPPSHPESQYRYIKEQLGLQPEDYGCHLPPKVTLCDSCACEIYNN